VRGLLPRNSLCRNSSGALRDQTVSIGLCGFILPAVRSHLPTILASRLRRRNSERKRYIAGKWRSIPTL
jgi:hypothetical protein